MANYADQYFGELNLVDADNILNLRYLWPGSLRAKRYKWDFLATVLQPETANTINDNLLAAAGRTGGTVLQMYSDVISGTNAIVAVDVRTFWTSNGASCSAFNDGAGNTFTWVGNTPPVFSSIQQGTTVKAVGLSFANASGYFSTALTNNSTVSAIAVAAQKAVIYASFSAVNNPQTTYALGGSSTAPKILFEFDSPKGLGLATVAQIIDHDYVFTSLGNTIAAQTPNYKSPVFGLIYPNMPAPTINYYWVSAGTSGYIGSYNGKRMAPFLENTNGIWGNQCYSPASAYNSSSMLYSMDIKASQQGQSQNSLVQVQPLNSCVNALGYPQTQGILTDVSSFNFSGNMYLGNGSLIGSSTRFTGMLYNLTILATTSITSKTVSTQQHRSMFRFLNSYYNYTKLPVWVSSTCILPCYTFLNGSSDIGLGGSSTTSSYFSNTGWTTFTQSADTSVYYVAASGSDNNSGLTPALSLLTLSAGIGKLRDNKPDWLLLKDGDTWHNQNISDNNNQNGYSKSGRSITERQVISSWSIISSLDTGAARPIINTSANYGYQPAYNTNPSFIALVNLEITASAWRGNPFGFSSGNYELAHDYNGVHPVGVKFGQAASGCIMENCYIHNFGLGLLLQGGANPAATNDGIIRDCIIRRNIVTSSYSLGDDNYGYRPQGVFAANINRLLFEENIFIKNGWLAEVSGAYASSRRKNIYFCHTSSNNSELNYGSMANVSALNNVVVGTDGAQFRSGGIISGNVISNGIGSMTVGDMNDPGAFPNYAVTALVVDNVMLDGSGNLGMWTAPDGSQQDLAYAYRLTTLKDCLFSGNIAISTSDVTVADKRGIWFQRAPGGYDSIAFVASGCRFLNNKILDFGEILWEVNTLTQLSANTFSNNDIQFRTNYGVVGVLDTASFQTQTSPLRFGGDSNNFYIPTLAAGSWFNVQGALQNLGTFAAGFGWTNSTSSIQTYPDPYRNLRTYNAYLGETNTLAAVYAALLDQRKGNWDTRYTAQAIATYIRQGVGL